MLSAFHFWALEALSKCTCAHWGCELAPGPWGHRGPAAVPALVLSCSSAGRWR